jgi:AMP deaminase
MHSLDPALSAELSRILESLNKCLSIREKWITCSLQRLGDNPRDHDGRFHGLPTALASVSSMRPDADPAAPRPTKSEFEPWKIYPTPPGPHWHFTDPSNAVLKEGHSTPAKEEFDFDTCKIPGKHHWKFKLDAMGVYQIYDSQPSSLYFLDLTESILTSHVAETSKPIYEIPTLRDYFIDLDYILGVISDGPTKSFAFRRLKYLASKYTMYSLLNEHSETAEMKVGEINLPELAISE